MRIKNKKTYFICKEIEITDDEGNTYIDYGQQNEILAYIYPASGKMQTELYGIRINYILNMMCDINEEIDERDGVCVYTEEPDYKVISIKRYTNHMLIELERLQ